MKIFLIHGTKIIGQLALLSALFVPYVFAHDPIFALGPHVLFKGGVEITPQVATAEVEGNRDTATGLELTYGLTGDWSAGIDLPYVDKSGSKDNNGFGDVSLFTKYRFWRRDSLGVQQSASVLARVKFDTSANGLPPLGSGSTDGMVGLAYGYESRRWYRWASTRYRINSENGNGLRKGNKLFVDLVGGIRFKLSAYDEPDTVWLIELNGEFTDRSRLNGVSFPDRSGTEWFISPGIFWTLRNFAVKAGVQIPVVSDLKDDRPATDYRARLILEWHF